MGASEVGGEGEMRGVSQPVSFVAEGTSRCISGRAKEVSPCRMKPGEMCGSEF